MLDRQREAQRQLVRSMMSASGLDLSVLARRAGLSPSTLTRFMNKSVKHLLSARTLARLAEASGVSAPGEAEALPRQARINAVLAVAEALDVTPAEVVAMNDRTLEWLNVISRLPASVESNALEMLRGLTEGASTPQEQGSPGERRRTRRTG